MSFFRVLLALLITGGIAYGLYTVVEEQKTEQASQTETVAERAAIADTGDADPDPDALPDPVTEPEPEPEQEPEAQAEPIEGAEPEAPSNDASFAARTAEAVDAPETVQEQEAGDAATSMPTTQPAASEAPEAAETGDDETDTADTVAALPAANIDDETSDSVAALDIVTGGMTFAEARETLLDAGWTPRAIPQRSDAPDAVETALIDAGYTELEGCSDAERPICRFEFVDGQKRIAAVLTAGAGNDPSVIDAFLMDIAKPE